MASKIERLDTNPFLDGPAEFLAKTVAAELKKIQVWKRVFGDFIDPYKRMDYAYRNFPAIRIYNDGWIKTYESWFIDGDLTLDVIWPPDIRRRELQQLPDTVTSAVVQQFRQQDFFQAVADATSEADVEREGFKKNGVPGLNQLGRRIEVDKSLAFQLGENEFAPLTQITLNFRVDLRIWDRYLEENNRTVDNPFEQTLGDLERLVGEIEGVLDSGETETDQDGVSSDQDLT